MTRIVVSRAILLSAFVVTASLLQAAEVCITVDTSSITNTMRGGIGASWHAIEKPISTEYDPLFNMGDHGGSAWGANPPAEDDNAWQQIYHHASWLGMDWIRVEIEQRMYEPERCQFDWDNPEMRILYRILDWCQKNNVDVFLQQMWCNVNWNAFPEFRNTPTGVVHSGPLSMDDFANGLATCVEHLVKRKGYTCIRWLCFTNEPGYPWAWWQKPPNQPMPLKQGYEAVRKALDARDLTVSLIGPDWVPPPDFDPKKIDFHELLGAYEFHSYFARFDWAKGSGYPLSALENKMSAWAKWTHGQNKPLFLGELGCFTYGVGGSHPGPGTYHAALHNAELVVRCLNAGVDGFNRWSFTNRGDLDGQFQLVDTWDGEKKELLKKFTPKANSYFLYGLLSRLIAKHSAVLSSKVEGGKLGDHQRVFVVATRSPKGNLTLAVVNDAPQAWNLSVQLDELKHPIQLYRYEVSQKDADRNDLAIEPKADFKLSADATSFSAAISPMSVTIYTTYKLDHAAPGVICDH